MGAEQTTEHYDFEDVCQDRKFLFADGREVQLNEDAHLKDLLAVFDQVRGLREAQYFTSFRDWKRRTSDDEEFTTWDLEQFTGVRYWWIGSPLDRKVEALIDAHPFMVAQRRHDDVAREHLALARQDKIWRNIYDDEIPLEQVDVCYARNILRVLEQRKDNLRHAMMLEEKAFAPLTRKKVRPLFDPDEVYGHDFELKDPWFDRLPLVVALRRIVEGSSPVEVLKADASQAVRKLKFKLTGSWN